MRSLIVCNHSMAKPHFAQTRVMSTGRVEPLQRAASDRPIARAQLVGLQAVQNAQHLFRTAADIEVVHRNVLDDVVRIDDERRPQRHPFLGVAHAELVHQRAGDVGELPLVKTPQLGMIAAPAELGELVVGRTAEHDRVAVLKLLGKLGKTDDFGRADEGEILRIEVDNLPLARKRPLVERGKGRCTVFLMPIETWLDSDDVKRLQFLTYGFHALLLFDAGGALAPRRVGDWLANEHGEYVMDRSYIIQFVYIDRGLNLGLWV